ncbi:MAG: adenosine deaminase [Elusimicrobia bacterium]|nr:adenosine deaminase [Elusimicrobiota bacterium]
MRLEVLRKLPKADLHCHLDGSIRTATILDLAREQGYSLPVDTVEELRPYVRVPKSCRSLKEFLECFDIFYPLLKNAPALERITYELLRDAAAENIRYIEVRFAPILQKDDGFPIPEVIEAVLRGIERGEQDFNIKARVIICLFRGTTLEDSMETVRYSSKYIKEGVCGIDVAGDESAYPLKDFLKPIDYALEEGLFVTVHAGEAGGPENVKQAVEAGAHRIGHGVALIKDPKLTEMIAKKQIPLEICITSNVQTQAVREYSEHPFLDLIEKGVVVTLNTDDRGISGIDLTYEYAKAVELGMGPATMKKVVYDGFKSAFASDEIINELIEAERENIEGLFNE